MSSLVYTPTSLDIISLLAVRYALEHLEACVEYAQTILNDVGQASFQSVATHPSQHAHVRHT
jgi:hypothetical protein